MKSPGRAHHLANRMVPAGPHRRGQAVVGGVTLTAGLARLNIMAAVLLFVQSPQTSDPSNT